MTENAERIYEERLLSFVDLCGFGVIVEETGCGTRPLGALYDLMSDVTSQKIIETIYGSIPTLSPEGTGELRPAGTLAQEQRAKCLERSQQSWPLDVTHFSDSFVISSPASNAGSTRLHLQLLRALVLAFLRHDVTVRGGMTAGRVIHERGGVLFGPAMNCAYHLESKKADWQRILIDSKALSALALVKNDDPLRQLLQSDGGEFWQITPSTCCLLGCEDVDREALQAILERLAEASKEDSKLRGRYQQLIANWDETLRPS